MFSPLTPAQLQRMKEHKYCSSGTSLSEPVMQVYWRWLVTKVPLWMAPNLITFVGLIVNILTTAPIVLVDYNVDGVAPRWLYLLCALGFFIYQSLDAIDGKQARRTGTNSPLGELFDHGCDSISTYLVVVSGISAIGVSAGEHPYMILYFMELLMLTNLCYHWQTYVCGVLHFKLIDVTEAQLAHILLLMLTFVFGVEMWDRDFPMIGVANNLIIALIFTVFLVINLIQAFYIILTGGVGKGGTTVAGTDVLSPIFAPLVLIPLAGLSAYFSPSHSLENNAMLFTAAFCLPLAKPIITMVLVSVSKSPYPPLDTIMLGPLVAFLNIYFGPFVPETTMLIAVTVYNILNITILCVLLCLQISQYLNTPIFIITQPPREPLTQQSH